MSGVSGKRIAVVGSGITGLGAAWLLQRNGAQVTLYESEATCGGHTLTDDSSGYPVDLGFQVFNLTTYPHLTGFLEALGVDSEPSDMSFALSVDNGRLEWGSNGLDAVFAQRRNLASPAFLAMVKDVLRFGREAPRVLDPSTDKIYSSMSLGEYLQRHGYSKFFTDNYIVPMCAAVWSVAAADVLGFPVTVLIRFWVNHHLLDIFQRPRWRVVKGRSREYVRRVLSQLPDVRTATPVTAVRSSGAEGPVHVEASDGPAVYDAVVLATHSDVSLRLLGDAAPAEVCAVLAGVPYNDNDVWLHSDASLMPHNRKVWASWNCLQRESTDAAAASQPVCVSYWINRLQDLPADAPDLFVTLNPLTPPAPDKVVRRLTLAHPVFGDASVAAQAQLPGVQGNGGIYLAGAWAGYGFHEDGLKSAIAVVEALGGCLPWTPRPCCPKIGWLDAAAMRVFDRFARAAITRGRLRLVLPNGEELCYGTPAPAPGPADQAWRGRPPLDATLRIYNAAFFRKVITRHDTGLGEAYMDGDYEVVQSVGGSGDLGSLLAVATANAVDIQDQRGLLGVFNRTGDWALRLAHAARSNTVEGSRRNIEEHYDAGNDMYRLFLDPSMTYSCGIWTGPDCDLHQSQLNKLDALIDRAGITAGHTVLEIGCGWGSFAMRAAQRTGCHVTGLTVSKEQLAEATARVEAAGLGDRVTLMFCDYRDAPGLGTYDRVVSCEMIEAVGHEHLEAYFRTVGAALKPGGRAVIQVIAEPDERYESYCASSDFIREHIFPGGHLPSMGACVESARGTGLSVHGCEDIGPDYAVTLRAWRAAWEDPAIRAQVLALGYSERFWRKYRFYFAYCEAGFDARYIHTQQVTWVKDSACTLTAQDIQRSLEKSRGIVASPTSTHPAIAAAPSSDPLTQVLLSLYFFLAGAAVSTSRVMWLLPLATALSAVVFTAVCLASRLLLPFYRTLSPDRGVLWSLQVTHLVYSSLAAAYAAAYVAANPSALLLAVPQRPDALPQALAAASAGFFGFVLWAEVGAKLYNKSYSAVVHYTILLVLFCAAAHKSVNTPFLAVTLLSEINSVALMLRRLGAMAGYNRSSAPGTAAVLAKADAATFVVFRLLLHAVLCAVVLLNPQAFTELGYYALAALGMCYMCGVNVRHGVGMLQSGVKAHAE